MQRGNVLIFLLVGMFIIAAIGSAFYLGRSTLLRQDSAGQATPESSQAPATTSQTPPPTSTSNPVISVLSIHPIFHTLVLEMILVMLVILLLRDTERNILH